MSKRVNWKNVENSSKDLRRKVKNALAAAEYLKSKPGPGIFIDNISKKEVVIKDVKSSSLRRYVKLLDNYYYLITSPTDRKYILDKKIEIERELNIREDGTIIKDE
jgi:hypothetical protein